MIFNRQSSFLAIVNNSFPMSSSDTINKSLDYSVIVPVYNSEASLEELVAGIREVFGNLNKSFEIILVDDHSSDRSWEVIRAIKAMHPGLVRGIALSKNFGQHNATFCGMSFASGAFIITIDDDLQTPPAEIPRLIGAMEESGSDLVYGIYRRKSHSALRNAGSRSLKSTSKALHDGPGDGSSFRLIKASLVNKILHHQQHFLFLDEIFHWYTDEVSFAAVIHLQRKYKQSGYSFARLVKLFANLVLYYTMLPLKFLVYGGFFISLLTFIYGLFFIFKKIVYDVPLGYTSLIVAILFSTSIILFSLGVLGEYLSRIYQIQNRKPPFSVKKVI